MVRSSTITLVAVSATLCVAFALSSCIEEDALEDDFDVDVGTASLSIAATSSLGEDRNALTFADSTGTVYTLTSSELFVDEIELQLPGFVDCDDIDENLSDAVQCESALGDSPVFDDDDTEFDAELKIEGPFVLDVVTGQLSPDPGPITIPALRYPEIDIELEEADPDDRGVSPGDPIVGLTWMATATFQDDKGDQRELVIRLSFDEELDIKPEGGTRVEEGDNLVVLFDVSRWLENIPLGECLRDGDLKTSGARVVVNDDTDAGACLDMNDRLESALEVSVGTRIE